MRFIEKVLVLFVAICVSVLGFNLIASSSVDLLTTARAAGYERIQTYLAKCNSDANQNEYITQNASQFDQPSIFLLLAYTKASLPEENYSNSSRSTQDK